MQPPSAISAIALDSDNGVEHKVSGEKDVAGAVAGTLVVAAVRGFLRALEQGIHIGGATLQVPQGMQEITLAVVLLLILVYRPQGIIGDRELGLAAAK